MAAENKTAKRKRDLKMVWRFLKGSRTLFLLSILLLSLMSLTDMLIPQIVRTAIDNVIGGKHLDAASLAGRLVGLAGGVSLLREKLWLLALAIAAAALVKAIAQYAFRVSSTKAIETFVKTTRDSLFAHIESLPYSWHVKNPTGDIIQRCTSDMETMKIFIAREMMSLFRIAILLVISMFFMFGMNAPLAAIALLSTPLIFINSAIFDRKIEEGFRAFDENEGRLSSIVQENLTGVRVVRAFGRESREREVFHKQNAGYTLLGEKVGRDIGKFWGLADIVTGLQRILVIVFGAYFCVKGRMTAGEFIAFSSYNAMLSWPLNRLGSIIMGLGKTGISTGRIRYIMEAEPERSDPSALRPPLDGDIVFDSVRFAYDGASDVLDDVSFTMKAGTTLGVLGGTGSGKSTLMLLLDKLYPLPEGCGSICIGGVDIRRIDTQYLRGNIGLVLQDPFLFSGTIGENIAIADEGFGLPEIRRAAAAACLDETISSFSRGYDTFVGERGVTLSGGQKQRAAIARVLIKSKPILIFDDSTSSVDIETDAKIRASLEALFGSASILIISHRISSLSRADKIIVLERGRIAEQGTHGELLAAGGLYRRIYDIQTGKEGTA